MSQIRKTLAVAYVLQASFSCVSLVYKKVLLKCSQTCGYELVTTTSWTELLPMPEHFSCVSLTLWLPSASVNEANVSTELPKVTIRGFLGQGSPQNIHFYFSTAGPFSFFLLAEFWDPVLQQGLKVSHHILWWFSTESCSLLFWQRIWCLVLILALHFPFPPTPSSMEHLFWKQPLPLSCAQLQFYEPY